MFRPRGVLGVGAPPSAGLWRWSRSGSYSTFDVVHNGDYVLGKELGGAAAQLRRLNVLENGTKLGVFLSGIDQISGQEAVFRQGGAEGTRGARRRLKVMTGPIRSQARLSGFT